MNEYLKISMAGILMLGGFTAAHHMQESEAVALVAHPSAQEKKLAAVFEYYGSSDPMGMARAVLATEKPELMAAVAITESNGRPEAVGDSGKSKGAFQVQERHWGKVSSDAVNQALQAERILSELVQSSRGRLLCGLSKYNAGRAGSRVGQRYASKVIVLARQIKNWRGNA